MVYPMGPWIQKGGLPESATPDLPENLKMCLEHG